MSPWLEAVERAVSSIPKGKTASYAQVALMAGRPGAARAVARALWEIDDIPWWRVVKSDGTVAKEMFAKQAPRLEREGVKFRGRKLLSLSPLAGRGAGVRGKPKRP